MVTARCSPLHCAMCASVAAAMSWPESNCRCVAECGAKRAAQHLQNIKLSMEFICFCRHSHKIAFNLNNRLKSSGIRARRRWLESVCKHLPTCIRIEQFIVSILFVSAAMLLSTYHVPRSFKDDIARTSALRRNPWAGIVRRVIGIEHGN